MDWKGSIREVLVSAVCAMLVAVGVSYTQLIRLDERVVQKNEQMVIRIEQLTEKTSQLRDEQIELRRQMMRLQRDFWTSMRSSSAPPFGGDEMDDMSERDGTTESRHASFPVSGLI